MASLGGIDVDLRLKSNSKSGALVETPAYAEDESNIFSNLSIVQKSALVVRIAIADNFDFFNSGGLVVTIDDNSNRQTWWLPKSWLKKQREKTLDHIVVFRRRRNRHLQIMAPAQIRRRDHVSTSPSEQQNHRKNGSISVIINRGRYRLRKDIVTQQINRDSTEPPSQLRSAEEPTRPAIIRRHWTRRLEGRNGRQLLWRFRNVKGRKRMHDTGASIVLIMASLESSASRQAYKGTLQAPSGRAEPHNEHQSDDRPAIATGALNEAQANTTNNYGTVFPSLAANATVTLAQDELLQTPNPGSGLTHVDQEIMGANILPDRLAEQRARGMTTLSNRHNMSQRASDSDMSQLAPTRRTQSLVRSARPGTWTRATSNAFPSPDSASDQRDDSIIPPSSASIGRLEDADNAAGANVNAEEYIVSARGFPSRPRKRQRTNTHDPKGKLASRETAKLLEKIAENQHKMRMEEMRANDERLNRKLRNLGEDGQVKAEIKLEE